MSKKYRNRRRYENVASEQTKKFERKQAEKQEERLLKVRELKKAGDKAGLEKELRLMNKRLNQRFRELEKRYSDDELKNLSAYQFAQNRTGSEKPRFTESRGKIEKKTIDELYEEILDRSVKLASKTSSLAGVKYLPENRSRGALEGIKQKLDIKIEDNDTFRDFLKNNVNEMVDNNLPSGVIFEFYQEGMFRKKSIKDMEEMWKKYKDKAGDGPIDTIGLVKWIDPE